MTLHRRSQIAEIARAAQARDAIAREAYLREACRDDRALRREVDMLLAAQADQAPSETLTPSADPLSGLDRPLGPDVERIDALLAAAGRSGHYRVVARVGAGGMGVVYKALDTRLNRAVALKAIRRGRAVDAGRLRQEARTAASLDHPYLCKVYELIDTETEQLIVMEFVEGETLSERLKRGVPSLVDSLRIAIEIAEGLAHAHAHGVVHRDLKPGNVMVTSHGHVKLLDFGLARLDATSSASAETQSAAEPVDPHAGTPYYMAPEQVEGRPVTSRADVFALGVVLFECATGRRPFDGPHRHEYVHRLRFEAPAPLDRWAPGVSGDLVRLVGRCLERTPAHRPESAEVVEELRRVAETLGASGTRAAGLLRSRTRGRWVVAPVGVALATSGVLALRGCPLRVADASAWQLSPVVTSSGEESRSRISPDGQWLSYLSTAGGETQVLVRRVEGGEPQRVELPAGRVLDPIGSADGKHLACALRQARTVSIHVVPAFFGGAPTHTIGVVPAPVAVRLLRWIGRAVYLETSGDRSSLHRLHLDSARFENLTQSWTIAGMPRGFDVSPDGGLVVFTASPENQEDLWVANPDGSSARRLSTDSTFDRHAVWSGRPSTLIYQSNRGGQVDLWEMSVDTLQSRMITSSPELEEPHSTSADGRLISFGRVSEDSDLWMWDPTTGRGLPLTDDTLSDFAPTTSATASLVVFQRTRPTPLLTAPTDATLHVGSLAVGKAAPFIAEPRRLVDGFAARLSPDGAWLAYLQRAAGTGLALAVKHLQTDETILLSSSMRQPAYSNFPLNWAEYYVAWSRSAPTLFFLDNSGSEIRQYEAGATGPAPPLVVAGSGEAFRELRPSPDGRSLAYLVSSRQGSTLHVFDLMTRTGRAIGSFQNSVYLRGWAGADALVVVRAPGFNEDFTANVEILVVPVSGTPVREGRISSALIGTTRLSPAHGQVYVTRSEAGVHNLYAYAVATRGLRAITDNVSPSVTFSGIEALDERRIIGVRSERQSDIWLGTASAGAAGTPR